MILIKMWCNIFFVRRNKKSSCDYRRKISFNCLQLKLEGIKLITMRIKCRDQILSDHLCTTAFDVVALDHVHQLAVFK